jgi:hypothetical protein
MCPSFLYFKISEFIVSNIFMSNNPAEQHPHLQFRESLKSKKLFNLLKPRERERERERVRKDSTGCTESHATHG